MPVTFVSTTDTPEQLRESAARMGDIIEQDGEKKPGEGAPGPKDKPGETAGEKKPETQAASETATAGAQPDKTQERQNKGKDLPPWMKARIEREKKATQRERERAERAERELEEARAGRPGKEKEETAEATQETTEPTATERPQRDQYATDEEYWEAVTDWKAKNAATELLTKRDKEAAEAAERERQEEAGRVYDEGVAECQAEYDDFKEVMEEGKSVALPQVCHGAITELGKDGPRMAYYLVKHPEIVDSINEVASSTGSVRRVLLELGRAYTQMKTESAPAGKGRETRERPAPPKPRPVASTAPPPVDRSPGEGKTADGRPDPNDPDFFKKRKAWLRKQGEPLV